MFPQIIGLIGRKYNGKDTVGDILHNNYNYERIAIATPLKEACKSIFGFTNEQLYGNEKEIIDTYWNVSPRQVLQFVGTELFRHQMNKLIPHLNDDIWLYSIKKQIKDVIDDKCIRKIVITDVRFENEVEMIKQMGGIIIHIIRPSVNNLIDNHSSENNIDNLSSDYTLYNDYSIDDLQTNVLNLLNNLKK